MKLGQISDSATVPHASQEKNYSLCRTVFSHQDSHVVKISNFNESKLPHQLTVGVGFALDNNGIE